MHRLTLLGIAAFALSLQAAAQPITVDQMEDRVKNEFRHFWNGYLAHGRDADGYAPLSLKPETRYGTPFYLTAVYALDALLLMHLDAEADSARALIDQKLSFDRDVYVPTAEFAGGVLGSLIASYQLTADKRLLELADDLGSRVSKAFISPTGMPYHEVNLKTGAGRGDTTTPGEVGSLLMDLGALTMITGKPAYFNYAKIAMLQMYERRSEIGLVGESMDISTGEWSTRSSSLGPTAGPYYENVLKSSYLFQDGDCAQIWQTHYAAITRYLLDSTAKGSWYGQADMKTGKRTKTVSRAYDAFLPTAQAIFKDFDRADRSMQVFCGTWTHYGSLPEAFNYGRGKIENTAFTFAPKFTEALYSMYRTSGEGKYLHMGKAILDSLASRCRVSGGYAELKNITDGTPVDRLDVDAFIATMRNLYLLFSPPEVLDFDRVILDPHGHPIRKAW
jgi:mannosidase alpha-like ER degradation enhancer 2